VWLAPSPLAIATAPAKPVTALGVLKLYGKDVVTVPLPSCPYKLKPQHCAVPLESSAQV
jgi:hypothetical protein